MLARNRDCLAAAKLSCRAIAHICQKGGPNFTSNTGRVERQPHHEKSCDTRERAESTQQWVTRSR